MTKNHPLGIFGYHHDNPPKPFNPLYDVRSLEWMSLTTLSMEKDGYYDNHTRDECQLEYRRRYEAFKAEATERD